MRTRFALAATAILTCSCAMSRDVEPERGDSSLAKVALALTQDDTGVYQLSISKDALSNGTEYLLSTSAILTDVGEPSFNGMLSRVVFFKRADGKVQMLESQKGATIDASLTKPNIVASFPIVAEDGSSVGLDFNAGIENLLVAFDWNGSEDGGSYLFSDRFSPAKLIQRYVDEGKTDDKGRISIHQMVQTDLGAAVTMELRYFLQPYQPDPNFPKLVSQQDLRWAGYFATSPTLIAGTTSAEQYVSRFNPSKPLKYAISSSTPAEVKEAVRDGILYWNRALGRDWIEVVDAPEGATAPNLDYNLVQWVPERGATFAYADAQLDPLTGEVTNAQVYFPSGWYDSTEPIISDEYARRVYNVESARNAAQQAYESKGAQAEPAQVAAAPTGRGAKDSRLTGKHWQGGCELVNSRVLAEATKTLLKRGLSDADTKRVALDWVRSAIAHEVGHTLGLRHNFAGSLGSNILPEETDGLVQHYFETGEWAADKIPGSSVMEYPAFQDDVAIGAHIRLGHPALVHDRAAIGVLYNNTPLPENGAYFCTDSEQGRTPDCVPNDTGADIVASMRRSALDEIDNAAAEYVYWLRVAKRAEQSDVFAATAADMDAAAAYGPRAEVARLLSSNARLLSADRTVGSPAIHQNEIHEESLRTVGDSIAAAGGYDDIFRLLPDDFDAHFNAQLAELLQAPWVTSGLTQAGRSWSFSADELEAIKQYAPKYLKIYRKSAAAADIATLSLQDPTLAALLESLGPNVIIIGGPSGGGGKWEPPVLSDELQQLLVDRAEYYATATSGELSAKVSMYATEEPEAPPPTKPGKRRWPKADGQPDAPDSPDEPEPGEGESEPSTPATPPTRTLVTRTLTLPIFTYSTTLRSSVADILGTSATDRLWLKDLRELPAKALSAQLDEAALGSFSNLQTEGSEPEAIFWILDNQQVLSALGGAPTPESAEGTETGPASAPAPVP